MKFPKTLSQSKSVRVVYCLSDRCTSQKEKEYDLSTEIERYFASQYRTVIAGDLNLRVEYQEGQLPESERKWKWVKEIVVKKIKSGPRR